MAERFAFYINLGMGPVLDAAGGMLHTTDSVLSGPIAASTTVFSP